MRFRIACILSGLLVLAACGTPAPAPTTTTIPDQSAGETATPLVVPTLPPEATLPSQARAVVTMTDPMPVPGTLAAPATEDPSAGQPYDRVVYEQSGGITGQAISIEILPDGTITRNGMSSQISAEQRDEIYGILDRLNVFGLGGVFTAPGTGADVISYSLTVERAGASRTIDAQDGFVPAELMALFTVLSAVGANP